MRRTDITFTERYERLDEIPGETEPFRDREGWDAGPWDDEPDKVVWVDDATQLDCMIVRNRMGALCGYVGVTPAHPWHGLGYGSCAEGCLTVDVDATEYVEGCGYEHAVDAKLEVHGGITFAAACHGVVCHKHDDESAGPTWWFGFDCAHAWDVMPAMAARERALGLGPLSGENDVYRDMDYVIGECESLALQLTAVAS